MRKIPRSFCRTEKKLPKHAYTLQVTPFERLLHDQPTVFLLGIMSNLNLSSHSLM